MDHCNLLGALIRTLAQKDQITFWGTFGEEGDEDCRGNERTSLLDWKKTRYLRSNLKSAIHFICWVSHKIALILISYVNKKSEELYIFDCDSLEIFSNNCIIKPCFSLKKWISYQLKCTGLSSSTRNEIQCYVDFSTFGWGVTLWNSVVRRYST